MKFTKYQKISSIIIHTTVFKIFKVVAILQNSDKSSMKISSSQKRLLGCYNVVANFSLLGQLSEEANTDAAQSLAINSSCHPLQASWGEGNTKPQIIVSITS